MHAIVVVLAFVSWNIEDVYADSCVGRCNQRVNKTYTCQCNARCKTHGDCCPDRSSVCTTDMRHRQSNPGSSGELNNNVLQQIWDSDSNRLSSNEITLNTSGLRLVIRVNETKLLANTFQAFTNLLDNYNHSIGVGEEYSEVELQEINNFLDAVLATKVMILAEKYLLENGKVEYRENSFRNILMELWFNPYSRSSKSNITDSSGFEHVMVGELKGTTVSGFHNWLQFYREEKAGRLRFINMTVIVEPNITGVTFAWNGGTKTMGTFFLGNSPELDMSLYTICALMFPNGLCKFRLHGNSLSLQTYDIAHKAGNQIGTAYPTV